MQQERHDVSNDAGVGPWRDGRYVVASRASQMPCRCMVCGAGVEALAETAVPLPRDVPARGIATGTLYLLAAERFAVRHGRCARHRVPWGKYAGLLAGIVSVAAMLALVISLLAHNERFGLVESALCGTFVVAIGATIWFALDNLRIAKTDGECVWIGGFGAGYLATLPAFQEHAVRGGGPAA
jgi:hypothetical protein